MPESVARFTPAQHHAYLRAQGARDAANTLDECMSDGESLHDAAGPLLTQHASQFQRHVDNALLDASPSLSNRGGYLREEDLRRLTEAEDKKTYAEEAVQRSTGALEHLHARLDPDAPSSRLRRTTSLNRIVREMRAGTARPQDFAFFHDPASSTRQRPDRTPYDLGYHLSERYATPASHEHAGQPDAHASAAADDWGDTIAALPEDEQEEARAQLAATRSPSPAVASQRDEWDDVLAALPEDERDEARAQLRTAQTSAEPTLTERADRPHMPEPAEVDIWNDVISALPEEERAEALERYIPARHAEDAGGASPAPSAATEPVRPAPTESARPSHPEIGELAGILPSLPPDLRAPAHELLESLDPHARAQPHPSVSWLRSTMARERLQQRANAFEAATADRFGATLAMLERGVRFGPTCEGRFADIQRRLAASQHVREIATAFGAGVVSAPEPKMLEVLNHLEALGPLSSAQPGVPPTARPATARRDRDMRDSLETACATGRPLGPFERRQFLSWLENMDKNLVADRRAGIFP